MATTEIAVPPSLNPLSAALEKLGNVFTQITAPINATWGSIAQLGNAFATLGGSLLSFNKSLVDVLTTSYQAGVGITKAFAQILGAVLAPIQKIGVAFLGLFEGRIGDALTSFKDKIAGVFSGAAGIIGGLKDKIVGVFSGSIADTIKGYLGGIGNAFSSVVGVVGSALGKVGSYLGSVGSAIGGAVGTVGSALGGVGSALGKMAGAAGGVLGAALSAGQAMADFVGKANPAALQMFTNAVDDLMAVIGQALTPVFRIVTQIIRLGADAFESFLPALGAVVGQMAEAFMPMFRIMFDMFARLGQALLIVVQAAQPCIEALGSMYEGVYGALLPVVTTLASVLAGILGQAMMWLAEAVKVVAPYIVAFARVLKDVFDWVVRGITELLGLGGIVIPELKSPTPQSSLGAAAKSTNISDVGSVLNNAMKSAFSLGTGAQDAPKQTVSILGELQKQAEIIYEKILELPKEISDAIEKWFNDLWEKLPRWAELPETITSGVKTAWETAEKFIREHFDFGALINTFAETIGNIINSATDILPDRPEWLGGKKKDKSPGEV